MFEMTLINSIAVNNNPMNNHGSINNAYDEAEVSTIIA